MNYKNCEDMLRFVCERLFSRSQDEKIDLSKDIQLINHVADAIKRKREDIKFEEALEELKKNRN